MACQVLRTVSKDEAERARLLSEYKFEVDTQSKMVQARRVGLAEGRAEARAEILNLLDSGKSIEEIKNLYKNQ